MENYRYLAFILSLFFLNQWKRKNDHRDIFMMKLKERMFQRPQAVSLLMADLRFNLDRHQAGLRVLNTLHFGYRN